MLTQDPIGLAGGVNLYAYAGNNPVSFDDPYGLCPAIPQLCTAALGALVAGGIQVASNAVNNRPLHEGVGRSMLTGGILGLGFGAAAPAATAGFAARVGAVLLGTAEAAGTAVAGAQGLQKLPRPETPNGMSLADFGQKVMEWGRGSADAMARIGQLSAEKLREAGVTSQMAQKWADFYVNEAARNPNNPSAAGRAELMKHVVDILRD